MNTNSSSRNPAALEIIDFEALKRKDPAEIEKLIHAGRTVGMFHLDLRGPFTKLVFEDMPVVFDTAQSFFRLHQSSEEKVESLREGMERGYFKRNPFNSVLLTSSSRYHAGKGFEYYEIPRDEFQLGKWVLPATFKPQRPRIARTIQIFHNCVQTILAELCAAEDIHISELSDDPTICSDTALKMVYKPPIHDAGDVIHPWHTDFGLITLLWYNEETTQIPIYDEDGSQTQSWQTATSVEESTWKDAKEITRESIIRVTGHFEPAKRDGNHVDCEDGILTPSRELYVSGIEIIALASPDILLSQQDRFSSLEERLNNRIIDVRHAASGVIFKLHSGICQLIVEFLCSNGFYWIHTPRIITATIPGDNEYFHLPYFGRDAWLSQSSQHHKQMALSMDMQRVFEIGPVFRAEVKSSESSRHLTEFTVLDIGMVFQNDYHEVMELIESMLVFVFRALQERTSYKHLIETFMNLYPSARDFKISLDKTGKVPRITFLEAKRILREELGFETQDNKNFTDQEEAALGRHFRMSPNWGGTDIFTIDQFPASMRQFNSQANPNVPGLSNTWDTIVRGREICSGSQRINSYNELCEAMSAGICGPPLDPKAEKWQPYLTAFKTGMPRHGGCGLGVNRLLQGFLDLDDVREATLFPRDIGRLIP
ncbi:hypothetical protein yc1106_06673 [Curvularia clavata]|uniref:aspartate--tRNA ligase n=1 Tax=Curvularia clavata TaxID=95742 RepID=A0A9Q8ZDD2_CURCL|nr:hypothetical protein yc1106_06673 [Curvularia clavata]